MSRAFYSPKEVADLLGVTAQTIRRWSKGGLINYTLLPSGQFRIPSSEVDRILAPANGGGVARCEKG
ncbi:helix-turn-helix domain-containing protein, partial [Actinobaculum suis]|uniref:helix-turn-helix domain-containing protein n=1 Tax=Actinobaculum suis TaxID=1657 RepID=UPI0011470D23